MKKILIATNLLTLSILFIAWNNKHTSPVKNQQAGCETTGHTLQEFKEVTKNYKNRVWQVLYDKYKIDNSGARIGKGTQIGQPSLIGNFQDARAIWFSLDSLKQFICTIEKYRDLLKGKLSNAEKPLMDNLGIRVFYAVYSPRDDNYGGRHTLFMMPTYKPQGSNVQVDFDPRYMSKMRSPNFENLRSLPPIDFSGNVLMFGPDLDANASILNNGQLCPPNCPTPNTFTTVIDN